MAIPGCRVPWKTDVVPTPIVGCCPSTKVPHGVKSDTIKATVDPGAVYKKGARGGISEGAGAAAVVAVVGLGHFFVPAVFVATDVT